MRNTVIIGSGSCIPSNEVDNLEFVENPFYFEDGRRIQDDNHVVIEKFKQITGIQSRRYVEDEQSNSKIAYIAGSRAIRHADIDPETIDMIIVAHNFGDVIKGSHQTDIIPSLASRVKHQLGIENPNCIPHDIVFGCPGWVQAVIHAHLFMKAGEAKRCLVIGSEVLSRILDPFDRDTMIFADGAGAVVLESKEEDQQRGILSHATLSHTKEELDYLKLDKSYNRFSDDDNRYVKMQGRKIYEYALTKVPDAMKVCLEKSGLSHTDLDKILLHQANEKMDEAIVKRFYRKFGVRQVPENILPMTIERLGNSSVATIPTMYDLIVKNELEGHSIQEGDEIMMASVGAGMNINAIVYKA